MKAQVYAISLHYRIVPVLLLIHLLVSPATSAAISSSRKARDRKSGNKPTIGNVVLIVVFVLLNFILIACAIMYRRRQLKKEREASGSNLPVPWCGREICQPARRARTVVILEVSWIKAKIQRAVCANLYTLSLGSLLGEADRQSSRI